MTAITYDPNNQTIAAGTWLEIKPCFTNFAECDSVQIDINEDLADVDVDRIPTLIQALNKAYELAMGTTPGTDQDAKTS